MAGPGLVSALRNSLERLRRFRDRRKYEVDEESGGRGKSVFALLLDGFLDNVILAYRVLLAVASGIYALWLLLLFVFVVWLVGGF